MNDQQQQDIKEVIIDLLQRMDIKAEVETRFLEETVIFNIKSFDSSLLIGQYGANLNAFQYLTRILVHKRLGETVHFIIDVENYKKTREDFLRELAKQAAMRVRDTHQGLLLKPMLSYERRVVHDEINRLPDIMSESVGDEPERRVLIKPKNNNI